MIDDNSTRVLSSDLAFADFLRKATMRPRREVVVWTELRLLTHLYDEETERLRPFASSTPPANRTTRRKRRATQHQFTARQLEIAAAALAKHDTEKEH